MQCGGPNNVGDLQKQPFYRFLKKTYIIHPIALGALLYGLGGLPFLVWGMVSKIVLYSHFKNYILLNSLELDGCLKSLTIMFIVPLPIW